LAQTSAIMVVASSRRLLAASFLKKRWVGLMIWSEKRPWMIERKFCKDFIWIIDV
jgi:hypothetical protein